MAAESDSSRLCSSYMKPSVSFDIDITEKLSNIEAPDCLGDTEVT